jgi:hypothetical protein
LASDMKLTEKEKEMLNSGLMDQLQDPALPTQPDRDYRSFDEADYGKTKEYAYEAVYDGWAHGGGERVPEGHKKLIMPGTLVTENLLKDADAAPLKPRTIPELAGKEVSNDYSWFGDQFKGCPDTPEAIALAVKNPATLPPGLDCTILWARDQTGDGAVQAIAVSDRLAF